MAEGRGRGGYLVLAGGGRRREERRGELPLGWSGQLPPPPVEQTYKLKILPSSGTSSITSGSRIWSRGTQNLFAKFCLCSKVSQYWAGSRACLSALKALVFLIVKYAFPTFQGTFSSNFLTYICVGTYPFQ